MLALSEMQPKSSRCSLLPKTTSHHVEVPLNTSPKSGTDEGRDKVASHPKKPKRPLSAYNLFFRHERERILAKSGCRLPPSGDASQAPFAVRRTKSGKRPHRKSHGLIGFKDLARAVASKWKSADPETRRHFEEMAAIEKRRYQAEMKSFNARCDSKSATDESLNNEVQSSTAAQQQQGQQQKLMFHSPSTQGIVNYPLLSPRAPSAFNTQQQSFATALPAFIVVPAHGGAPRVVVPSAHNNGNLPDLVNSYPSPTNGTGMNNASILSRRGNDVLAQAQMLVNSLNSGMNPTQRHPNLAAMRMFGVGLLETVSSSAPTSSLREPAPALSSVPFASLRSVLNRAAGMSPPSRASVSASMTSMLLQQMAPPLSRHPEISQPPARECEEDDYDEDISATFEDDDGGDDNACALNVDASVGGETVNEDLNEFLDGDIDPIPFDQSGFYGDFDAIEYRRCQQD